MAKFKQIKLSKNLVILIISILAFTFANPSSALAEAPNASIRISNIELTLDETSNRYLIRLEGIFTNFENYSLQNINIVLGSENQISSKYSLSRFIQNRDDAGLTETNISAKIYSIEARTKASWRITFFADEALTLSNGLYGLGVTAYGPERIDSDVVTIPIFTAPPISTMRTVIAVQLSTLNTHLANGGANSNDVLELSRLINLIKSAKDLNISWIVDPSLYQWIDELKLTELQPQAQILNNLLSEISSQSIPSVYSQPDVSRLIASERYEDLSTLVFRTKQQMGNSNLVLVAKDGRMSTEAISKLGELGVKPVVTNQSLNDDKFSILQAHLVVGKTNSLVQDAATLDCFRSNSDTVTQFQIRNCLLANVTLSSIGKEKDFLLVTPVNWAPSEGELRNLFTDLNDKSWLTLGSIGDLYNSQPDEGFETPQNFIVESFPLEFLETSDSISIISSKTSSMFLDVNYSDTFTASRLRAYSSLWPTGDAALEFLKANENLLTGYQENVLIEASKNITVSNSLSQIPITVVNNSDRDISIVLKLVTTQSTFFKSDPSEITIVPSGKRITIPMNIDISGDGIFNVTAALYAPNGQPVGKIKPIQISSAEYQGLARTLVLTAFGVLVLLSLSNIAKRRKTSKMGA